MEERPTWRDPGFWQRLPCGHFLPARAVTNGSCVFCEQDAETRAVLRELVLAEIADYPAA